MTEIEPATMDDLDRLVDLWLALAESQRAHGSTIDPAANEETMRESLAQHVFAGGLLVARAEGSVRGFVMFGPDDSGLERERSSGVVRNVYVVPEARGEGRGAALLAAAERRLADAGVETVHLEVMADNEAARRFYRREGYEPHRLRLAKPVESDTPTK